MKMKLKNCILNKVNLSVIILIFLGTSSLTCLAQGDDGLVSISSFNVAFPSPNVASLQKFSDIPMNYASGIPNISIPLHQAQGIKLELPISISYNASGIKVDERTGLIGLGWALNAGGVISRTMYGLPDDDPDGYYYNGEDVYKYVNEYYTFSGREHFEQLVIEGYQDSRPDVFNINMPGINIKFMFDKDGNVLQMPYSNLIVEPAFSNGKIVEWVVKDESGITYTFDVAETSTVSTINRSGTMGGMASSHSYVSSWYLSEIKNYTGEIITLDYTSTGSDVYTTNSHYRTNYYHASGGSCEAQTMQFDTKWSTKNTTDTKFLNAITTAQEKIIFNRTSLGYANDNQSLNSIVIKNKDDATKRTVSFGYENQGVQRRLLDSVTISGPAQTENHIHAFDYYDYSASSGIDYTSDNKDYWGYYNGALNNDATSTMVPEIPNPFLSGVISGDDREPDNSANSMYAREGSLKKIVYPTGGYAKFAYEPNIYSLNSFAGGIRIDSVIIHDGMNHQNDLVKTYEYPSYSGYYLNGQLETHDILISGNDDAVPQGCHAVIRWSTPKTAVGPSVGYSNVIENIISLSGNSGYNHYHLNTAGNLNSWKRGKILSKMTGDSNGDTLQKVTNSYNFEAVLLGETEGVELKIEQIKNNTVDTTFTNTTYVYNSYWMKQVETVTKTYDQQAQNFIETTKTFFYNDNADAKQLSSIIETNSDGQERQTEYKYAHEIYNSPGEMKERNMLTQPYSVTVKAGSDTTKSWTLWKDWGSGQWLPCGVWVWDGEGTLLPPANCSSN